MKIRYTGRAGVREIGPYRWDETNGFVQDVTDPVILEDILTYPRPVFEVVDEPTAPAPVIEEKSPQPDEISEAEYDKSAVKPPRKGRATRKE